MHSMCLFLAMVDLLAPASCAGTANALVAVFLAKGSKIFPQWTGPKWLQVPKDLLLARYSPKGLVDTLKGAFGNRQAPTR